MMKGILYLISLNILLLSFTLKAEEMTLESLHSTEGALLNCKKDQLELGIYGETYRSKIMVIKVKDKLEVKSNTEYYNLPIGFHDENLKSETIFIVESKYFIKNKKIISAISLDPLYLKKAREDLSTLVDAIKEAHENNKCVSWNFE
ncbi:hypothetical protein J3U57_02210 [Gilliamella sp. B3464]|uniref:hypothetical protein n=1 Tax=unclassified Gilliamella TaxID=2685620 RepID=UPI00226A3312|nr:MULTISPECIES: hypothetical protein [unclassified Gilliamella]MCX8711334.1 hypothetical protein [Gilliamella sp. B3468]MCX8750384.1 hypothetical protein [Gilliamella sp. B3464]